MFVKYFYLYPTIVYIMKEIRNSDIVSNISDNTKHKTTNIKHILIEKIKYIQEIVRNTILSVKRNNNEGIFSNNDSTLSISILIELYEKSDILYNTLSSADIYNTDDIIDGLQQIINKLSVLICGFGTTHIDDLLFISFGSEFKNTVAPNSILQNKYDLVKKYIRPIGYKIIHWNKNKPTHIHKNIVCDNKITEEDIKIEDYNTLECFDVETGMDLFVYKVYGLRVVIHNEKARKSIIINGILDDIHIDCINNEYIKCRKEELKSITIGRQPTERDLIINIINNITFKDILIYGNDDIIKKVITILIDVKSIKHNLFEIGFYIPW